MMIRIMKQEALDLLKSNLDTLYDMYYSRYSNDWIYDIFQGDPFVDFKEVQDFELENIDYKNIGKTDFENCKILQDNLSLTPSQASDERLWAGLCHDVFYNYVRRRWKMDDRSKKVSKDKAIGLIKSRFFYKGGKRSGIYRNTLSKCWWVGRLTKGDNNDYELLNKLGYQDLSTKVNDIFRNYTFISNSNILEGIINGIAHFKDEGIKIGVASNIRPVLQYINAVGGGTLLDYWTSDEIRDLFIEQENNLLNGISMIERLDSPEEDDEDDTDDDSESLEEDKTITVGSKIKIKNILNQEENEVYMMYNGKITPYGKVAIKKKIDDEFEYNGTIYRIIDIKRAY